MSESKVPTHLDLMWPTLQAIKQLGDSGTNQEILDKVIEIEGFPEDVQNEPHKKGKTKLEYRAFWARSYLKMIGAVENTSMGVWAITQLGENIDDKAVREKVKASLKEYRQNRKSQNESEDDDAQVYEDNEQDWKICLLDIVKKIQPDAFERLCQRILRESGFIKVQVTGRTNDGGIDGIGVLRVNLLSFQVSFQCKRYQGSVSSSTVRDFRGAMIGRCDKGLVITTGSFTAEARKEATRDGAPAIDLIDGEELCELLKKLNLGVETKLIEKVMPHAEWFEAI
jgi:restriction system protein